MSERLPIFAVILAAGKGTRMKSNRAKVLHTLCGVPMVNYVIEATRPLVPEGLFVVVGHQAELVEAVLPEDAKRSEEHTSELQSRQYLVCRLLLEKKKNPPLTTASNPTDRSLVCTSRHL